jgi:hypothetical protein
VDRAILPAEVDVRRFHTLTKERGPMARSAALLAILAVTVLGLASGASALAPTCLPGGFPETPTPPVVSATGYWLDHQFYVDVLWRKP